ncbi:MAG: glucose-6-phosphate dehydrogenase [Pirellulales bacterium]
MSARFVILGATGDLTGRYLMPAVASLYETRQFPVSGPIVGVSQEDWDTKQFREHIAQQLEEHARDVPAKVRSELCEKLEYRQADVTDPEQLAAALGNADEPIALYLALPPAVAGEVLRGLSAVNIPNDSRIVCEKPFGHDLASARELNDLLRPMFAEHVVFRMDHFLGKQTVQNVLGLRFANRIFEYLWSRDHIEHVEIIWDETVALEGRAGYYDTAGALRDMVQNHLLQLLCLIAMEAPLSFDQRDFRDRKVDVLRAVRKFSEKEAREHSVRARYTAGSIGERDVPNYVDEPGVESERQTETFALVTLFIDNWRWNGVPFVLRTGKALSADRHEIVIHFRSVPYLPFEKSAPVPNVLRLQLDPDRMELSLNINGAGDPFDLERAALSTDLRRQKLSAYARLLLDVFEGDAVLSIRGDEAEEAWKIVDPIIAAWSKQQGELLEYPAGSDGPEMNSDGEMPPEALIAKV